MMNTNPADDFLGANPPASTFKFDQVGDTITGMILDRQIAQQRAYTPPGKPAGELLTWPDGQPKMQAILTVQADGIEATADDDGRRRVFVKGKNLTDAFRGAFVRIGHRGSVVGCRIQVSLTGFGTAPSAGASPPKEYEVKVAAPIAAPQDEVDPALADPEPSAAPAPEDEFGEEPF